MPSPTLVAYTDSSFTSQGAGTRTTGTLTWQAGDLIVVVAMTDDDLITFGDPSTTGDGLSFTAVPGSPVGAAGACTGYAWTATASQASSGTISATSSGGHAGSANGIGARQYRDSGGLGNVALPAPSGSVQTASLTRSADDSAVLVIVGDWGAGEIPNLTSEWTPTPDTIHRAVTVASQWTLGVAEWADEDAAGTTSYGTAVTANGSPYTRIALEVLGETGPQGTVPLQVVTPRLMVR